MNVADIMLLPTNTDVRLTFMSGKTFIVPISTVQMQKDFGFGSTMKFQCVLQGKKIECGLNYEETPDDSFDPLLLMAIMSPKVSKVAWG